MPTPETQPCSPDSYYGITKFAAERYVHATAGRPDLPFPLHVTSLRMFSVFGPGQAWDNPFQGVLGIFLGRIQRGEPITIFGVGLHTALLARPIGQRWQSARHLERLTSTSIRSLPPSGACATG